ncbi:MAG: M23 family metallopeptidase [Candidatus Wallbacteria bacterium]|nr:M23 family metallopeptidase [Candidatus Wallbacteria bacterium]
MRLHLMIYFIFCAVLRIFAANSDFQILPDSKGFAATFGEFRGSRLHAGMDFRCEGEGIPVRAMDDGLLVRMKAERYGYGKSLYLKNDSGEISLFAHLSMFENRVLKLEDKLLNLRKKEGRRYPVDCLFESGTEPQVRKGQILGYTGQTGSGTVHLHYEIRRDWETPINYIERVHVKDTRKPVIESLEIVPAAPGSLVNSLPLPLEITLQNLNGIFRNREKVSLSPGTYCFRVKTYDQMNQAANHLGVYLIDAELDSVEIYCANFDYFKYSEKEYGLLYDLAKADYDNYFYNLQIPENVILPGIVLKSEKSHTIGDRVKVLKVTVADFCGNSSRAEISFSRKPVQSAEADLKLTVLDDFVLLPLGYSHSEFQKTAGTAAGFQIFTPLCDLELYYQPGNDIPVQLCRIIRFNGLEKHLVYQDLSLDLPEDAIYQDHYEGISVVEAPEFQLKQQSDCYFFENGSKLFKRTARVSIIPWKTENLIPAKICAFGFDRGHWSYLDSSWNGSAVEFDSDCLKTCALFYDDIPPRISQDGAQFSITDTGCGIDPDSVKVWFGSEEVPVDFDPETRIVFFPAEIRSYFPKSGAVNLTLEASDRVGNKMRKISEVSSSGLKIEGGS